ncbi:MAG: copper amine oxidase N-terminal domain-containing protein [Syntrophomonas sp.]
MKKILTLVLVFTLLLSFTSLALASSPGIFINGKALVSDSPAVTENGRTLVPLRAIFEALGQSVQWNGTDRSITSGNIWLQLDNAQAKVGDKTITLDVPAKAMNGRTFVPLRFIAESLGKDVKWIGEQNKIEINNQAGTAPQAQIPTKVKANPSLEYDLTESYYEDGTLMVKGIFENTGNCEITKIDSMQIKVFLENDDGDSIMAADDTYTDLALDIKPGESVEYILETSCTTEYTDATKWWDETSPGTYEYIDIE